MESKNNPAATAFEAVKTWLLADPKRAHELSDRSGVPYGTVRSVVMGNPRLDTLIALYDALPEKEKAKHG